MDSRTTGQEQGQLDALLGAAVDGIIIIDSFGVILRFNRAAQRLFGVSEEDVIGCNVSTLMPEPYRSMHDRFMQAHRSGGPPSIIGIGREIVGLHASGRVFPMHLSVGMIEGSGAARYVGIIRDLSEEKATEDLVRDLDAQLAHADRLVTLGELTAGIAHEINQPLTAIAAYADAASRILSRSTPELNEKLEEICRRIAEQARRAGDVVTRLRKLSYKGELTRGRHNVRTLLSHVLLLFEHEIKQAGVQLETRVEEDLPEIYADEIQVQQVLVNLIKNSIDALVSSQTADPLVVIEIGRTEQALVITVRDNGPGVSEALELRMFEPFFTTKQSGVGLGLSICRNIAIAHGGNLTYRRLEAGGAEFCLTLPLELIG
jgi:two-component system sensor kinase FixL